MAHIYDLNVFFFGLNVQEDVFSNGLLTKHIHLNLKGFKNHMQLAQRP
jgi:hypothetical protein